MTRDSQTERVVNDLAQCLTNLFDGNHYGVYAVRKERERLPKLLLAFLNEAQRERK